MNSPATRAGFARSDITAWEPEMAMMGWGRMDNRITGVHEPLHARAAAFSSGADLVVYCCIELMAVSLAIRSGVLERLARDHAELGLDEHRVMLTATHTHSGPSGYSHYFFMNLNGPGFSPVVLEAAVSGAVRAIVGACENLCPVDLVLAAGEMPLNEPVVFNRSWFAYNLNRDVDPVTEERRDEAVDRTMTVLEARALDGTPLGCIAWFPVHCTSVHAENDRLHSDNKGIAAAAMEATRSPGYVAIHAQEASGDVTPNFRHHRRRGKLIGRYDDDYASAEFNGNLQARLALDLLQTAPTLVVDHVAGATHYSDFSNVEALHKYSGIPGASTTPAVLGLSMAEGTDEGPGPLLSTRPLLRALTRRRGRRHDDPKIPMLEVGQGLDGRFLGFSLRAMRIPAVEPTVRYVKRVLARGQMSSHSWIPQILPVQVLCIGPLLIVGVPFELTTVAGRRLRAALGPLFGAERVIVNSYANGYAGYCTTFEEYQLQHYEAGYTLFGPHQLAALLTRLEWMAEHWGEVALGADPPIFEDADLRARAFDDPWRVPPARARW